MVQVQISEAEVVVRHDGIEIARYLRHSRVQPGGRTLLFMLTLDQRVAVS